MDGIVFIGAVIIALTQVVKYVVPQVNGAVTILVAVVAGIVVASVDSLIGVADLSIAEGIMAGLAAVGTVTTASALSSKAPPKTSV